MKNFLPLLLITFWLYQCASTETEQDQTTKETLDSSKAATEVAPKTIPAETTDFEKQIGAFHKQVPYMMFVKDQVYFIVASINWQENKGDSDKQDMASTETYKVGLVNERNEIIIPIKYDKIYNMGGLAANLIEVELNGKLGAYDISGKELLKAEFDGIYPYTNAKDVWVQIRKGDQFGWLSTSGSFSMDPSSHPNKALFEAQSVANLFTNWSFDSKSKQIIPLFEAQTDPKDQHEIESGGILVFPSYLYHLGLVPELTTDWNTSIEEYPVNGETTATIEIAHKTGNNQTIISAFSQYFSEPRGYYEERSDIITVNDKMEPIDKLSIEPDYLNVSFSNDVRFRFINDNTLEMSITKEVQHPVYKIMTSYNYHNINAEGKIIPIDIKGFYTFTRTIKITDFYFKGCFVRNITTKEREREEKKLGEDAYINFAKSEHLTIADLDLMRNEIYAAHGYRFKSKKWQDYFGKQAWYTPQFDNVDDQLSEIEKHNVTAILNQKKKMEGHEAEFINTTYGAFSTAG